MMATMPAKIGASKLVPPATVRSMSLASRKPFVQLPLMLSEESLEQYRKPALLGDAVSARSGTNLKLPDGIPATPVCQPGRAVKMLVPPPPEERPPDEESSFQTCSGM